MRMKSTSTRVLVERDTLGTTVQYVRLYTDVQCFVFGQLEKFFKHSKTSFEKNCFSAWASTLNMGLINKVDMVCLSPVGYGV